ncbi:MAG TPA: baseplate J/gp47 family protein [Rhizomicrobium sp.]|nr:baseplate J/gp47 family protein [Rhizomicrobium sp.]
MPLPVPKLDDRSYSDLLADALVVIDRACPEWTDRNPADPGVTLLEAFAFLTENMLYRLNRVPSKQYVTLLNLVGVQLRPPSAAQVALTFTRTGEGGGDVAIPLGTQVATGDGGVIFTVTQAATIPKGGQSVTVYALHCEQVDGELVGVATGTPGQSVRVKKAPVIAPSGDNLDIVVGIEATPDELTEGIASRGAGGKAFALWQPLDSFADATPEMRAYRVDRASGLISFAPIGDGNQPMSRVPPQGREIRVWYRRGGGRAGNVAAGALTALKTPLAGVGVTNADKASGGSDPETAQEAIRRGPLELTSMRCAVTARDFERIALTAGGVARARAFAQAQLWRHADAGVVSILLVPSIDTSALPDGAVTAAAMSDHRRDELLTLAGKLVDDRRPLGVRVALEWTRVRPVSVSARVVVTRGEDAGAIQARLRQRLNGLFSPFVDQPFGRALRASDAYEALLAEPGVRYADQMQFTIGEAPDKDVNEVIRDPHQPRCWFAAAARALYRSLDDGESWSTVFLRSSDVPQFVRRHPDRPGLVALGAMRGNAGVIHLSSDCGESWTDTAALFAGEVTDAAWITRNGAPVLLIAAKDGLYQFQPGSGTGPALVVVDKANDANGYYGVAATTLASGIVSVAVVSRASSGGVYLSAAGGVSDSFHTVGLNGKYIRVLKNQRFNGRDYLWAAVRAEAGAQGEGAMRIELRASGIDDPGGWVAYNTAWQGGSCEDLSFADGMVFAGSNRGGTLSLDVTQAQPRWTSARLDAGLPIRDKDRLLEVCGAMAAAPAQPAAIVMMGGPLGVYRSLDGGNRFALSSATVFTDRIPLPPNWLYCADTHALTIVTETGGD